MENYSTIKKSPFISLQLNKYIKKKKESIWISSNEMQMDSLPAEPQWSPRILEWVAYPFSSRASYPGIEPGSPALQADSLPTELWGKLYVSLFSLQVFGLIREKFGGALCILKAHCLISQL